jgi:hypothetical protein
MAARDDASPGRREEEARELDAVAARVNEAPSNQDHAAREHEDEVREDDGEGGEPKADRADGIAAARDQEDPFMTTPINSVHRTVASLKLPGTVPALITYAQGIVKGMTGNTAFPTPSPSLPTVTAAINDLQTAETAALARTKGAVATRNEKRIALASLLQLQRAYIQSVADAAAENAPSIIQSAGIAVRKTPVRAPRVFEAKPGALSGTVKLVAPAAARRASYDWEYSIDGAKSWVAVPGTLQARTTVTGLTPVSTVQFRYCAVTQTGQGDWSAPVSLLVK